MRYLGEIEFGATVKNLSSEVGMSRSVFSNFPQQVKLDTAYERNCKLFIFLFIIFVQFFLRFFFYSYDSFWRNYSFFSFSLQCKCQLHLLLSICHERKLLLQNFKAKLTLLYGDYNRKFKL